MSGLAGPDAQNDGQVALASPSGIPEEGSRSGVGQREEREVMAPGEDERPRDRDPTSTESGDSSVPGSETGVGIGEAEASTFEPEEDPEAVDEPDES
jgi:hypothetical protein